MNKTPILVPLDGSRESMAALSYGAAIARATGAALLLLTVLPSEVAVPTDSDADAAGAMRRPRRVLAQEWLDATAAALRPHGVAASALLAAGDPADAILASAERQHAALIVMATHGSGGIERWLLGSVSDEVMRRSVRPILLVPPADIPVSGRMLKLRRLLVPLDGSDLAEEALPLATEVALRSGARLLLARVVPPPYRYLPSYGSPAELERMYTEEPKAAAAYLEAVQRRLPPPLRSDALVLRSSNAAAALLDCVQNNGVDLTVMSTHGRHGFRRFVVGSTADRLVRSGVPALLIHPTAGDG